MTLRERGRVLSASNEKGLQAAMSGLQGVVKAIQGILAQVLDPEETDDDTEQPKAKEKPKKAAAKESLAGLAEAANTGEWLESRIHLMFTEIADGLFGDGRLTRDERIALSGAIGAALDAFRVEIEENAAQLYQRDRWKEPPAVALATEAAIDGDAINLTERAIRADGTAPLKLISPGWGSSGYYPPEVLQRDGPQVFVPGLKMYWNHPTPSEEAERPEGDLRSLAGELISAARWDDSGPAGPGLYAEAKVFEPWRPAVNELASHIGVSIRAVGKTKTGEIAGRKGPVIEAITGAKSVDYVTIPGAGGQILQLFEAARNGQFSTQKGESSMNEQERKLLTELAESVKALQANNQALQRQLAQTQAERQISAALATSTLPAPAHTKVLAEALRQAPITEAGVLDVAKLAAVIVEAIKAEENYLQSLSESGRIIGMGSFPGSAGANGDSTQEDKAREAAEKRMKEAFQGLGLDGKELDHAVNGHFALAA